MKNTTTKHQEAKPPKTIAISVLVPWVLVIILITAFAGLVAGWNWRSVAVNEIEHKVALSSKEQAR